MGESKSITPFICFLYIANTDLFVYSLPTYETEQLLVHEEYLHLIIKYFLKSIIINYF